MNKVKYLIIGAGPTGLSLAHSLLRSGESSVLVLEKNHEAGGLCRSTMVGGHPLDIGGGHFLDTSHREVTDFIFDFLPRQDWNSFHRNSKILYKNNYLDYPFESNLWQLPKDLQIDFLESIAVAGCNLAQEEPGEFESWIRWKLGNKIAEEYMLPYNRKIWSIDLNELGTYWLNKLPNVSFRETLASCLDKSPYGQIPAHKEFLYPKNYGYGEVWQRMGIKLYDKLWCDYQIHKIDLLQQSVNDEIEYKYIINTAPWSSIISLCNDVPTHISDKIKELIHIGIRVEYVQTNLDTKAHWVYVPNEDVSYHRILNRNNFIANSQGHWTETNLKRTSPTSNFFYDHEYSYPVNSLNKPKTVDLILNWFRSKNILGLGRWGQWEHINSDIAVKRGMLFAQNLMSN